METVFIIGPARSGTKILRDSLALHSEASCIPYDINFLWKFKAAPCSDDCLKAEDLQQQTINTMHQVFRAHCRHKNILFEKTVSNCVRVNYVKKAFPDAKFIYLFRNPVDVIESVKRQWGLLPKKTYLLKKFLSFPLRVTIPYSVNFFQEFTSRKKTSNKYIWGVKYSGYQNDLKRLSLLEIITKQWCECYNSIKSSNVNGLYLSYEELVKEPRELLIKVSNFLGKDFTSVPISQINTTNINKGRLGLSKPEIKYIHSTLKDEMEDLGYGL